MTAPCAWPATTPARVLATAGAFGLLEVITGLMPGFWSFLVMLVPTGLAVITFTTTANSTTQLAAAADMPGRVMGLYLLVFLGGAPLGSPMAGWIAEQFGPRMSMVCGGLISIAATAAVGIMLARRRGTPVRRYLRASRAGPNGCLTGETRSRLAAMRAGGQPALRGGRRCDRRRVQRGTACAGIFYRGGVSMLWVRCHLDKCRNFAAQILC
jgi:MFS family permease